MAGKCPQVGEVLEWAERQVDVITENRQWEAAQRTEEFGISVASGLICTAVQVTISDQLRTTKPALAGDGMGL